MPNVKQRDIKYHFLSLGEQSTQSAKGPVIIELFICIKMDLPLDDLQRLICHKTQTKVPVV